MFKVVFFVFSKKDLNFQLTVSGEQNNLTQMNQDYIHNGKKVRKCKMSLGNIQYYLEFWLHGKQKKKKTVPMLHDLA